MFYWLKRFELQQGQNALMNLVTSLAVGFVHDRFQRFDFFRIHFFAKYSSQPYSQNAFLCVAKG